jgi:hypothetical protein
MKRMGTSLLTIILIIGIAGLLHAECPKILMRDLSENIYVELDRARVSRSRGRNLEAIFIRSDGTEDNKEIFIRFPAHSFTPHELTITEIIEFATDIRESNSPCEWNKAKFKNRFSIPKNARTLNEYCKWVLIYMEN